MALASLLVGAVCWTVYNRRMSLQRVPINNFRGGLNTRDGAFDLQPNESPDLLNVTISALVGQLEARRGKVRTDISGLPANEESADFAKQAVIGNEKRFLMLSINGGVYAMNPAGEVKKLFAGTAGTIWDFEVYSDAAFKDWVYMVNGSNPPQKWDGVAAATVEWKATAGVIPGGNMLVVWENRMFISGVAENVQRLFFSEFGDPEATIKEYGFVDVRGPEEDLDAVQDIAVLGARLFVLKRRSVFYISSAVTMANRRVGGPGVYGRFQTVELEDKLYFFNPQGIFSTGGVQVSMESGSINNYFPKNLNREHYDKVRMMATKDTYPRLLLAVPTGLSATNNALIEMVPHINFRRIGGRRYLLLPAFLLHTLSASALAAWNPKGQTEIIVGAGLTAGSGGSISTFPPLSVLDTMERGAEKPLSNEGRWSAWAWAATTGNIVASTWRTVTQGAVEGARWNAQQFGGAGKGTVAEILVEAATLPLAKFHPEICVHICYEAAARTGYTLRFHGEEAAGKQQYKVTLESWTAGVKTIVGETTVTEARMNEGTRVGISKSSGVLAAWINPTFSAEPGWKKLMEAADVSFVKGYAGFEATSGEAVESGQFNNFRVGEVTGALSRVYQLFEGTTDEGVEFEAHWQSSWMAIQGEEPIERVRRLNVELTGDAVVDVFTDFATAPKFSAVLSKVGGSGYRFTRVRPETRGRFHSVRFRSLAGGLPFSINTAELAIRGGKEH